MTTRTVHRRLEVASAGEDPTDDVFVDIDAEGKRELFGDAPGAEPRIAGLHRHDRRDEFGRWAFGAGPAATIRREEPLVLAADQDAVKRHDRRGSEDDGAAQQAGGTDHRRAQGRDDAISGSQAGCASPRTTQDQQLVLEKKRLGDD